MTDPTAECDLIMKGGITSGVVYPRAAGHLAQRYRFRRLGGASAGAIAAAFVAAAEHGRTRGGFDALDGVPDELGSKLSTLFQPSPSTRPAFELLTAWIEPEWGLPRKTLSTVSGIVRRAPIVFVVALAVTMAPILAVERELSAAVLVWLPGALVVALLAAAARLLLLTLRALPANGYGLCDGQTRTGSRAPAPLTEWIATELDRVAGLAPGDGPLTFRHLWGEEAAEAHLELDAREKAHQRVRAGERRRALELRQLDLEVMTTNLTFRRPYRFPFATDLFLFCQQRLRTYFPQPVVDHMVARSTEVPDEDDRDEAGRRCTIETLCPCHRTRLRHLPPAPDLPLVLAARLSLSFPGLISAVPLFCIDWSRGPGHRQVIEVWFSDGGIASNFPMHLFDAPWPDRPTFGINLQPPHPDFLDQLVWRAPKGSSGIVPRSHPMHSMIGFAHSILDTMQNWTDSMQITMPGFRDRVAELRHREDEGGINLRMNAETITRLADRGAEAAALFDSFDHDLHRWIRYRVAAAGVDELLDHLSSRYHDDDGVAAFLNAYGPTAPSYAHGSTTAAKIDAAATAVLMDAAKAFHDSHHPATAGRVPHPRPVLRTVPRQ
jgi:predicted acylesterase/phospholipase RssA